ncbi:MAG: ABC transporter substrate-binding protein [Candidatus Leucobacter sulfamidivorax]|nr:ABC transporter substrate-binding protein [Candidatus Leucobacter sulfamidivorax]
MKKKLLSLTALAALVSLTVGCAPPASETEQVESITQGISEDKVVDLGAFISQSGPLSFASSLADGVQSKLDSINEDGGINGYTFKFTALDDGSDPARSATLARELWDDQQVFAILSPYGSAQLEASMSYLASQSTPVLFPFAGPQQYAPEGELLYDNIFGFTPSYASLINQMLTMAHSEHDVQSIAIVHTNNDFGQEGLDAANAVAAELGLDVVETIGYNMDETNLAPMGRRIAASGADAVVFWPNLPSALQIISSAESDGYQGLWLTNTAFVPAATFAQLTAIPGLDERVFISIPLQYAGLENPSNADMTEYRERFLALNPNGDPFFGYFGWTAASMFEEGVKRATDDGQELTWESLKAALLTLEDESISGAEGITYTPTDRVGVTRAQIMALSNGELVSVGGFQTLTDPLVG